MHGINELKTYVQGLFTPVVMVISSPEAEAICLKNNLHFAELLRPFCKLSNLNGTTPSTEYVGLIYNVQLFKYMGSTKYHYEKKV
jgi:hypothetical protein